MKKKSGKIIEVVRVKTAGRSTGGKKVSLQ
jgi:hypothetical protein